jgi:hypothetical protein
MSNQWREEQNRCQREIDRHRSAEQSYMDEGVQILELARNAPRLFERQEPRQKRRLLNFVLSNLADDPVNGELVSTVDFPINRENTGNILENRPWDGKSCRRFFPRNQVVGQLIPCSAKQGILSRRSGKIRGRSGKRAGVSAN